jgi:Rps23 Pro-64 3,4-dihydroxylase Tpa1-like proline 4-hydroxylase
MDKSKVGGGLAIPSSHDAAAYARVFHRAGRIYVRDFLTKSSAERAHAAIADAPFKRSESEEKKPQHAFDAYRLMHNGTLDSRLSDLLAFLHGAQFMQFAKGVAREPALKLISSQAVRFRAGDYAVGTEQPAKAKTGIAFVINLTPKWQPRWGGLHLFVGEDGNIAEGYAPEFNALTFFRTDAESFVSQITEDAAADRLAITGLLAA